jgi:hypothetical protein
MVIITLCCVFLCVLFVDAYEDNNTNVGVYVNHISSCNVNHGNGNMLCINRDYESVIQYHDVDTATFCPYHYCVTFRTTPGKLACTGYVYLKMSGSMNEEINPLTPNITNTGFTGNPTDDYVKIGKTFEGFNILIDRFEQSVETYTGKPISDVQCKKSQTTCISYNDGSSECFGSNDLIYHGELSSILLGVLVTAAISFGCYSLLTVFKNRYTDNICVTMVFAPVFIEVCVFLILFVASDFIVKYMLFIFMSLIGIWVGFLINEFVWKTIKAITKYKHSRVDDEKEIERSGMLRNKNRTNHHGDDNFVIREDDEEDGGVVDMEGMSEVELGTVIKRI